MVVTGVYKRKTNYDIYLDNEFAFTLSEDGLYKLKLSKGKEFVPSEKVNQILQEDEVTRSKNRAMYMVSVTQKSIKYIEDKLKQEGFSEYAIEKTVEFLKEYSLVDDIGLAEAIVNKENRQHKSQRQIQQKLMQRGISKADQKSVMDEIEVDDNANALETALKKYKSVKNKPEDEIIKKIMYTLSYRGFSYSSANYAMSRIKEMIKEEFEADNNYEEI